MNQVAEKSREEWTRVCALSDIVPDTGVCCLVAGKQVAVFRLSVGDRVLAIGNHDPFSRANVLSRGIVGDVSGEIVVASPVYKNHFCLRSGRCLEDESWSVQSYAVRVSDDGMILVREA